MLNGKQKIIERRLKAKCESIWAISPADAFTLELAKVSFNKCVPSILAPHFGQNETAKLLSKYREHLGHLATSLIVYLHKSS